MFSAIKLLTCVTQDASPVEWYRNVL